MYYDPIEDKRYIYPSVADSMPASRGNYPYYTDAHSPYYTERVPPHYARYDDHS